MKSLTKHPSPTDPRRAVEPVGVLFNRDPATVRRWIVSWRQAVTGDLYALAGGSDFVIDLAHALRDLMPEEVEHVEIWPAIGTCPRAIFQAVGFTLHRMKEEKANVWGHWSAHLDGVGFTLPIWLDLRRMSEETKSLKSREN